jgi:hypothetical protein
MSPTQSWSRTAPIPHRQHHRQIHFAQLVSDYNLILTEQKCRTSGIIRESLEGSEATGVFLRFCKWSVRFASRERRPRLRAAFQGYVV